MPLDSRKMRILQAIIDDYILTAAPVGSRTISRRDGIGLSSATIRNEMSDLEELGYLEQPHTSAGRIPSEKAFRLYVDNIFNHARLTDEEAKYIKKYFSKTLDGVESVVKQTAAVLSEMTLYTSMVLSPQLHAIRLRHIQIVPLNEGTAIVVIVTDTGITKNALIRLPYGMSPDMLDRVSHRLTSRLYNCRVVDIDAELMRGISDEYSEHRQFLNSLIDTVQRNILDGAHNVELSGTTNMLNYPEYSDLDKAKKLLSTLEGRDVLYKLLSDATKLEFSVTIGKENNDPAMKECSVVTATYRIGNMPLGSMGIIGPTRMDYTRVLAILRYMRRSLSEVLTNMFEEDEK